MTFANKTQWFLSESSAPWGFVFFSLLLPVNPFYALELEDDILLHHVRQHHNFFQQTISNLAKQTELNEDRQPSINKGSAHGHLQDRPRRALSPDPRLTWHFEFSLLRLEWRNRSRRTGLPETRLCGRLGCPLGVGDAHTAGGSPGGDLCLPRGPCCTLHSSGLCIPVIAAIYSPVCLPFCLWSLCSAQGLCLKRPVLCSSSSLPPQLSFSLPSWW